MGRLFEHSNCPNPVQWGSSPVKTAYIRATDPETKKTTWQPVGWICTGCGIFRANSGWFPSGKTVPLCKASQPPSSAEIARLEAESRDLTRVTIAKLQRALQITRAEILEKIKAGEIPVEKDKYRHWYVPYSWLEEARTKNEH